MIKFQRLERQDAPAPVSALALEVEPAFESDDMDIDNRRRAPRINAKVQIRYRISGEGQESSFALNLSRTGARIVLRGAKPSFRDEMTVNLGDQVDLCARTVWEEPLPGGHCRIAGISFELMVPSQRAALDRYLCTLELA